MQGKVVRYGLVDSTNERALQALHEGHAQHGDVHVADGQTAGRGRLGRRWASALGEGLYVTLVVRPGHMPPTGSLTLAGGLAALDTCRALGLTGASLDWPNDLVVGEAKLGGVLTESRGLDLAHPAWVVGVGLNLTQTEFPAAIVGGRAVTSFTLEGCEVDRDRAETLLVDHLRHRTAQALAAPGPIFRDAFEALRQARQPVQVDVAGERLDGVFSELHAAHGLGLDRGDARAWVPLAHVRSVELERR
jgi:biotin-[acetyl-CoA-carboxylase] ligase BirA-like protein